MALIKYGLGITQISGSQGGTTFARNRYGNYVRAKTKPVNPNTTAQATVRSAVSFCTSRWFSGLSSAQRTAWKTYADAVTMKNKLGETTFLTGFNHYIRSNASRKGNALAVIDAGPTTLLLPEKDTSLAFTLNAAAQQLSVEYDNGLDWANETGSYMLIYMGQPQQATRNFFGGPWKYAGKISGVTGAPPAGPAILDAPFTVTASQRVWLYARIVRVDGRITEKMFTNSSVALSYTMTGVTVPTSAGIYLQSGMWNDKSTFFCTGQTLYIWWDGINSWIVSTVIGTPGAASWKRTSPNIIGLYTAQGTATGNPTLSVTP